MVISDRAHSLRFGALRQKVYRCSGLARWSHIRISQAYMSLICRYAEFKVVGNASVHLSGYYMPEHGYGEQTSKNWLTCVHTPCINGPTRCPLTHEVDSTSLSRFKVPHASAAVLG